jgi:hypothetical protein
MKVFRFKSDDEAALVAVLPSFLLPKQSKDHAWVWGIAVYSENPELVDGELVGGTLTTGFHADLLIRDGIINTGDNFKPEYSDLSALLIEPEFPKHTFYL